MAYDWPVRKAHMDDVKDIHALLLDCAQKGLLLPRALIFLYGHVRNFWVVDAPDGGIAACCALAPVWEDLGEICSLVVREDLRRHGLGFSEADRLLGYRPRGTVFCLLYKMIRSRCPFAIAEKAYLAVRKAYVLTV